MAMTKKGNLFYLVKSLTKSEKRYFKIFCFSEKVNKNYLKLFEAYEKMEVLDEAAIKKKFAKIKQLHVTKNYLNNLILASLRSYHSKISKNAELKDCLRNIEILFQKELLDQCHFEIQRGEKLAREYELMLGLVEILNWKRRLHLTRFGLQKDALVPLYEEEKNNLQKLYRLNEYWGLMGQIFHFMDDKEEVFLKNKIIQEPEAHQSLPGNILYHHLLYTYYTINHQPEKGKDYLVELIQFLEEDPSQIRNDSGAYITAINNLIGYYLHQKEYEEVLLLLEKTKQASVKYQLKPGTYSLKLQLRSYNIELEIYRDLKDWQKGRVLGKEIEAILKVNQKIVPDLYALLLGYQLAYIYFMSADFDKALKWVNQIINHKFDDANRKDLESYARILNLMIHFELGNIIVLKYAIESCRRWMKKRADIHDFERVLLRFFSKISNAPKGDYPLHFKQLEAQLFAEPQPLVDANILDYLDFKAWIVKHLSRKYAYVS
jgi:hypothetical protein